MTAPAQSVGSSGRTTRASTGKGVDASIDRTRRQLATIGWLRAALVGAATAAAVLLAVLFLQGARGTGETIALPLLVAIAAGIAAAVLVRMRAGRVSALRAALWMEERAPSGYARIALAEDAEGGGTLLTDQQRRALSTALAGAKHEGASHRDVLARALSRTARKQLAGPALFAVLAAGIAAFTLAPSRTVADIASTIATSPTGSDTPKAQPIGAWTVRVVPPAYSGLRVQSLGDANSLRALAGSRIELRGEGAPPVVNARVIGDTTASGGASSARGQQPTADGSGWRLSVSVPASPLELRASRGGTSRLLLVDAYGDSIPHVSLELPARDSVLRRAVGSLPLAATAHDDLGLATASFELIVSTGEGERFTARTVTLGAQRINGARDRQLRATLDFDALKLGPGDVVHLRAVARDAYPLAGREAGSSETRSFRIARQSEYDSVAVEPAPPPAVDSSLLSQRMLLMLTERLEKRRPSLVRATLVSESQRIARDQSKLRQTVGNVVFQRLTGEQGAEHAHSVGDGHDHAVDAVGGKLVLPGGKDATGTLDEGDDSPIIAVNKPLLEAYNAMWDAGRALEQAEPKAAIPHMKIALAAIERARAASRLYLRGKPPVVIVDLAKVRLTGKDTGSTNLRSQRTALSLADAARERRLLVAVSLLPRDATAGRDSLAVLRLESVADAPLFAQALDASLEALRGGRDVTPSLLRARRALGGVARVQPGTWSRSGGT